MSTHEYGLMREKVRTKKDMSTACRGNEYVVNRRRVRAEKNMSTSYDGNEKWLTLCFVKLRNLLERVLCNASSHVE